MKVHLKFPFLSPCRVVTEAWVESHADSGVWSASRLSWSGRDSLSLLASFFLISGTAFFHQMMKWPSGQDEGPEFSQCRQDPGCLGRNTDWCPDLYTDMMIRQSSRKYSHNHPVASCHSQSHLWKYPLAKKKKKKENIHWLFNLKSFQKWASSSS